MRMIGKPTVGEFAPYAAMYIDLLPDDGRVLEHLGSNFEEVRRLVSSLPEGKLTYRYAPGKWSIKEILVHIVDDERIYAYRVLRFARGDRAELPGFEQDDYARTSGADERLLASIFAEYQAVRPRAAPPEDHPRALPLAELTASVHFSSGACFPGSASLLRLSSSAGGGSKPRSRISPSFRASSSLRSRRRVVSDSIRGSYRRRSADTHEDRVHGITAERDTHRSLPRPSRRCDC